MSSSWKMRQHHRLVPLVRSTNFHPEVVPCLKRFARFQAAARSLIRIPCFATAKYERAPFFLRTGVSGSWEDYSILKSSNVSGW